MMRVDILGLALILLSISLAVSEDVACQTRQQCDEMREELGYAKLFFGMYPAKGCFRKGDRIYFGSGGTPAQKATPNLQGVLERVWCTSLMDGGGAEQAPQEQQASTTCLTERQCDERRQELGISVYRVGTNYPSKGCFKKGTVAYFGSGGTVSEMSSELPGARERIQCVPTAAAPTSPSAPGSASTATDATAAGDKTAPDAEYHDKSWNDIPANIQAAYEALGYDEDYWCNGGDEPAASDKGWSELSAAERAAAEVLGYDRESWNGSDCPAGASSSTTSEEKEAPDAVYHDEDWSDLPDDIQAAYEALGYDEDVWCNDGDPPASEDKDWSRLSAAEKAAASVLGYDEESWDNSDCLAVAPPTTTLATTIVTTVTKATVPASEIPSQTSDPSSCPDSQYIVKVVVQTGPQNRDSGFKLSSGGKHWLNNPVGSLPPLADYAESVCLSNGRYRLRLEAELNGIKRYWVYVNGEEVLRGPAVNASIKFHIIRVGYKPTLSIREQEWLEGHNSRRQGFHESNGEEFRPLKWSGKLAQQAQDSADAIIANNCKYTGSSGGNVGENKALRRHSKSSNIAEPDLILRNWIDNKIDREYPDNFTLTAAVWRGSRWIGCAESTGQNDEGLFCHATSCRYSRPGNCNMRSFDNWLDAVLDDGSMCGAICPDEVEGCH